MFYYIFSFSDSSFNYIIIDLTEVKSISDNPVLLCHGLNNVIEA